MSLTREQIFAQDLYGNSIIQQQINMFLAQACEEGTICSLLIETRILLNDKEYDAFINHKNHLGQTALSLSLRDKRTHACAYELLNTFDANPFEDEQQGAGTLFFACYYDYSKLAARILAHKNQEMLVRICNQSHAYSEMPNTFFARQLTPLQIACINGSVQTALMLMKHPTVNLNAVTADGSSALLLACANHHGVIARMLLRQDKVNANLARYDGMTPLMLALINELPLAIITTLIPRSEASIHFINSAGNSALDLAINAAHARHPLNYLEHEIITQLLRWGAKRNQTLPDDPFDFKAIQRPSCSSSLQPEIYNTSTSASLLAQDVLIFQASSTTSTILTPKNIIPLFPAVPFSSSSTTFYPATDAKRSTREGVDANKHHESPNKIARRG